MYVFMYVCMYLCVCVCVCGGVGHKGQFVAVVLHNLKYPHYYWGDQIERLDGWAMWNA